MLEHLPADAGHAEPAPGSMTGASPIPASDPVEPDPGVRRLGWLVIAGVVVILVTAAVAVTRLPGLWGSDRPASPAAPAATWLGDFPGAGDPGSAPAGTPTNPAAPPPPAGGPATSGNLTGDVPGQPATPGASTTTAPAGAAGSGLTPAASNNPATSTTAPTAAPAGVRAALSDLSAGINSQVAAGQLDPEAGDDLQSKVQQVAREASEGNWAAARYYADRIREKLGKYLDDGMVTATGYQALITKVDALDAALSGR